MQVNFYSKSDLEDGEIMGMKRLASLSPVLSPKPKQNRRRQKDSSSSDSSSSRKSNSKEKVKDFSKGLFHGGQVFLLLGVFKRCKPATITSLKENFSWIYRIQTKRHEK